MFEKMFIFDAGSHWFSGDLVRSEFIDRSHFINIAIYNRTCTAISYNTALGQIVPVFQHQRDTHVPTTIYRSVVHARVPPTPTKTPLGYFSLKRELFITFLG